MRWGCWSPDESPEALPFAPELVLRFVNDTQDPAWALRDPPAGAEIVLTYEPYAGEWGNIAEVAAAFPPGAAVRYGHEFNGTWYPWAGDPTAFRQEWRVWSSVMSPLQCLRVWSPNVIYPGAKALHDYWPPPIDWVGFDQVDVIGLDGYSGAHNGYPMPAELFGPTIAAVERYGKPIWITETACGDPALKEAFIAGLAALPVEVVIWFHEDKEEGWRWPAGVVPPGRSMGAG